MQARRICDREGHAHFVTFSCYRRRRLLDHDRARRIVVGVLGSQLGMQRGRCVGFVVMPDHVHAIVHFPAPDQLIPDGVGVTLFVGSAVRTDPLFHSWVRSARRTLRKAIAPGDPV